MNNHQNTIFHQFENFLKTPLTLLGVDLKNSQINKICHFANHPYLCKGLYIFGLGLHTEVKCINNKVKFFFLFFKVYNYANYYPARW